MLELSKKKKKRVLTPCCLLLFSPSVVDWYPQNGKTSRAWNFSGGTRFAWTMPSGELGTFSVRTSNHTLHIFSFVSLFMITIIIVALEFVLCRCGETRESSLPFCYTFGWDNGFRSPSTCRGERVEVRDWRAESCEEWRQVQGCGYPQTGNFCIARRLFCNWCCLMYEDPLEGCRYDKNIMNHEYHDISMHHALR